MKLYRLGSWCYKKNIPAFPKLCDLLIRLIHNCVIYSQTSIGKGTIFGYGGIGVVIHKHVKIGSNCVIGTNVTIGGRSRAKEVPVIGDDVFIATGAKILGAVNIGSNSVIGANAVVINDVPANSVVVGVPAKVIKTNINPKDFY
ncbi:serine O-acetyltransferase [Vibrio anguillarum]|uniref:serine O-acetyltransferase n=1 Tax=Vibrio anguillarum TaxID=55601 RepID=UPI0009803B3F|nr:serine acetyltransferase [Vibrio anguillarum]AQP36589.1 serine acetyltransferase [Vibrio anguillarum]